MLKTGTNNQDVTESEQNGLSVTFCENTSELTFIWNPETNPEYNFIKDVDTDTLIALLAGAIDEKN